MTIGESCVASQFAQAQAPSYDAERTSAGACVAAGGH